MITKFPKPLRNNTTKVLKREASIIGEFFDKFKASPNDLILSGIILNEEIQNKQKSIYIALKNENLWDSFCSPMFTTINLSDKYKKFLLEHLNKKLVRIPFSDCENETVKFELFHFLAIKLKDIWNNSQYKNQDKSVTEATFSCQYIVHLIEFLKGYTEHTFQTAWNSAESVATKCRNNQDGPRRCPDNFWFLTSQKLKNFQYEFFYLEISGGPFANLEHINNQSELTSILSVLKKLQLFALHIYGTTLVVYIIERKFGPLFHMKELVKIDLPVHKPNENEFITFIETLITISGLLKQSLDDLLIIENLLCDDEYYNSDEKSDISLLFTETTMRISKRQITSMLLLLLGATPDLDKRHASYNTLSHTLEYQKSGFLDTFIKKKPRQ
ncbi:26548_t:CDS:2, partial [Gigaspora margarita]